MNYRFANRVRPLKPDYGPKMGEYVPTVGTVAKTFEKARKQKDLEQLDDPFAPQWFKAVPHGEQ